MGLSKFDKKSDGIADIYRAALYLARGDNVLGLRFLNQAKTKISKKFTEAALSAITVKKLTTRQQQLYWAEKVLDQYLRLKNIKFKQNYL